MGEPPLSPGSSRSDDTVEACRRRSGSYDTSVCASVGVVGGKSLEDLKRSPNDVTVTPAELRRVLEAHGWSVRAGPRHGFVARHERTGLTLPFPRPHGKHLLGAYVKRAVKFIEEEDAK